MEVVSAQEMRDIDSKAIQDMGIPGIVLMENAGMAVVYAIENEYDSISTVSIFVGKGNNGGDGLVIGRHLENRGYNVEIYLMAEPDKFTGDALINLKIVQNMRLPIKFVLSEDDLATFKGQITASDLIVDSIFGTGLRGAVRGFAARVIDFLNSIEIPTIAVDLPSGLEADTGKVNGSCIRAALTVTMAKPKRGLLLYPGADFVGELQVADIGIPHEIADSQGVQVHLTKEADARKLLPMRRRSAHKGSFGKILVLAGSVGFTGAAAMTSEAALRAGAGLVTLGIPKSLNPIMEVKVTEVMTLPLPETDAMSLSKAAYGEIMGRANGFDVLAIGPGLSRNPETVSLICSLCREIELPKVIDADGLNALAENRDILKRLGSETILTPHPGEMARLMNLSISDIQSNRIEIAQNFARENGIVLVLKGAPTVIADTNGTAYINSTGNPGLASGGTGDVLTGTIAGLIAQGLNAIDAAILGVYLHGLAGDLAAMAQGEAGMLAGDVLQKLPSAIQKIS